MLHYLSASIGRLELSLLGHLCKSTKANAAPIFERFNLLKIGTAILFNLRPRTRSFHREHIAVLLLNRLLP